MSRPVCPCSLPSGTWSALPTMPRTLPRKLCTWWKVNKSATVPRNLTVEDDSRMIRKRVLVIEDERQLTDVLRYNLERDGYEAAIAHDGQEGLRKAQAQLPDLIILDLMLPGMDGLQVCRELRGNERTRRIPI